MYNRPVREATQEDAEAVEELEMSLFPDNCMGRLLIQSELRHGKGWLIERRDEVVAYALVRFEPGLVDLTRLGVRASHQGRGLGKQLLLHILGLAPTVVLAVRKDNEAALRLYRKHSFGIVGETSNGSWTMRATSGVR